MAGHRGTAAIALPAAVAGGAVGAGGFCAAFYAGGVPGAGAVDGGTAVGRAG